MHAAQPIWLRPRNRRSHAAPLALCCVFILLGTGAAPPAEREAVPEKPMAQRQRELYREKVRTIFTESLDAYMENAFPMPELKPKTCSAGGFDPCELPMLSLVDSLDTLAVLGNDTQFELTAHSTSSTCGRRSSASACRFPHAAVRIMENPCRVSPCAATRTAAACVLPHVDLCRFYSHFMQVFSCGFHHVRSR